MLSHQIKRVFEISKDEVYYDGISGVKEEITNSLYRLSDINRNFVIEIPMEKISVKFSGIFFGGFKKEIFKEFDKWHDDFEFDVDWLRDDNSNSQWLKEVLPKLLYF